MSDPVLLLADHITSVVNADRVAGAFAPLTFTARRSYPDWGDDFADIKDLAVDVVFVSSGASGGDVAELDSTGSLDTEPAIDIAIRKRFDTPADREANGRLKNSVVDALVNLVGQIHVKLTEDRLSSITLEAGVTANWVSTTVRTYCDYDKLRKGCFLGCVRVRFDVSKEVS